ncbi:5242_t:CDS:2 [Acaulospora colombiana]|uniref:5242_t:CDS:1 n=1 Tax=Acaulospora colombiana TaxID=27376 RepID=A0ACA9MW38_9GLOM|nr:5242_t:CDS:2 [Acaulospora colombiana]
MSLIGHGWDNEFGRFENSVTNLFDDFFKDLNVARRSGPRGTRPYRGAWVPALDVHETEKEYVVNAELPGISKDQISLDVRDSALVISGENKQDQRYKEGNTHIQERRYGSFSRTISLPPNAKSDDITAKFEQGILEVKIPKGEAPEMTRTKFRPCIDLHNGQVKQIVGGSLNESSPGELKTNFISSESPSYYAELYKQNNLTGAHVIKLGAGNDEAAREALNTWPGGLQIGGGITIDNAEEWLKAGADKIIVTSYLFPGAKFSLSRLQDLCEKVGRERIVVDVSCRRREDKWIVAMNKWQTMTDMEVNRGIILVFPIPKLDLDLVTKI